MSISDEKLIDLCLTQNLDEPDFSFFMGLLCMRYVRHLMVSREFVSFAQWSKSDELAETFINWIG